MSEPEKRPWWVPLLGVGSIGLGGFQCLFALLGVLAAAEVGGSAGTVFIGIAAAWFLPGILLLVSGIGVVVGARWGRVLSLVAAGTMVASIALVASNRKGIPEAIASLVEFEGKQGPAVEIVKKFRASESGDPVFALRDPDQARISAWFFTGYCGCAMPWYLLVLSACALPSGRRIATPTPPGASRTPAP